MAEDKKEEVKKEEVKKEEVKKEEAKEKFVAKKSPPKNWDSISKQSSLEKYNYKNDKAKIALSSLKVIGGKKYVLFRVLDLENYTYSNELLEVEVK